MKKLSEDEIVVRLQEIIEGCHRVKEDYEIHEDAVELARLMIRDCNKLVANIRGKRFPGDNNS